MSESRRAVESFLRRWSRRKQASAMPEPSENDLVDVAKGESNTPPGKTTTQSDPPAFDPATLPPIESITAESDIRAFLAPGVPIELSRAALRRAWATDPAIRDFIGIAENQWDFTKPDSVPGFGSLEWTPELRQVLARLVGDVTNEPLSQKPLTGPTETQVAQPAGESLPPQLPTDEGARQVEPVVQPNSNTAAQPELDRDPGEPLIHRKHGSALPKSVE